MEEEEEDTGVRPRCYLVMQADDSIVPVERVAENKEGHLGQEGRRRRLKGKGFIVQI